MCDDVSGLYNLTASQTLTRDDAFSNDGGRSIVGDQHLIKFHFEVKKSNKYCSNYHDRVYLILMGNFGNFIP